MNLKKKIVYRIFKNRYSQQKMALKCSTFLVIRSKNLSGNSHKFGDIRVKTENKSVKLKYRFSNY